MDLNFKVAHTVALDLGALNIQRGRDHGLAGYTSWTHWCGLTTASPSWSDLGTLIQDNSLIRILRDLYGHPNNIDVWVGSILETRLSDARVGPTTQCLLIDQFRKVI